MKTNVTRLREHLGFARAGNTMARLTPDELEDLLNAADALDTLVRRMGFGTASALGRAELALSQLLFGTDD